MSIIDSMLHSRIVAILGLESNRPRHGPSFLSISKLEWRVECAGVVLCGVAVVGLSQVSVQVVAKEVCYYFLTAVVCTWFGDVLSSAVTPSPWSTSPQNLKQRRDRRSFGGSSDTVRAIRWLRLERCHRRRTAAASSARVQRESARW